MSRRFSDELAIIASIPPAAAGTGTSTAEGIDLQRGGEVTFILQTGSVLTNGTVDMTVNSGTASGTVTTSVTDITQLIHVADSNKEVIVTVDEEQVSGRYLNATVKQGTANSIVSLVALARRARFKPAADNDLASVDEIVNVT